MWFLFDAQYLDLVLLYFTSKAHCFFVPALSTQTRSSWGQSPRGSMSYPWCGQLGALNYMKLRGSLRQPSCQQELWPAPALVQDCWWMWIPAGQGCWLRSAPVACPWPSFPFSPTHFATGHLENCHHLPPVNCFPNTCGSSVRIICIQQLSHRKVWYLARGSRLLATSKFTSLQSLSSFQQKKKKKLN